jgi:hypothetical protein
MVEGGFDWGGGAVRAGQAIRLTKIRPNQSKSDQIKPDQGLKARDEDEDENEDDPPWVR